MILSHKKSLGRSRRDSLAALNRHEYEGQIAKKMLFSLRVKHI